jgi:hypothetical protein
LSYQVKGSAGPGRVRRPEKKTKRSKDIMGEIKSSAVLLDGELSGQEARKEFSFTKFDSDPYHPKTMKWDSDNATSESLINMLFKNVEDTKILTIQKEADSKIDPYIRNAHKKKLAGDKKGGIDIFQIRFVVDGNATSLRLINPKVSFVKDLREGQKNFFVFTLKTEAEVKKGGVGI